MPPVNMNKEQFFENIPGKNQNNVVSEILKLWSQYMILLSNVCSTAAYTKLNEVYLIKEAKHVIPWSEIIRDIEAFRNKLTYCIENNLPSLILGKSDRLFGLSDGREQAITSLKNLVKDLKITEPNTIRYNNLKTSIISLFNSLNILLIEINRIFVESNYNIQTSTYNLSKITKNDIGLK